MSRKIAIIGRGAVGSAIQKDLSSKHKEDQIEVYHSQNIYQLLNTEVDRSNQYDYIIYAGVPGIKWKANQNPEKDMKHIKTAFDQIKNISQKCKQFILISSIDTMTKDSGAYGNHRKLLEDRVLDLLNDKCKIVQLPALVGRTVQKNVWHDLYHPYPKKINQTMFDKIQTYAQKALDSNDEFYQFDENTNEITYLHNKAYYVDNQLGLYNATHPYSKMLWLNINELGDILLNPDLIQTNQKTLIASRHNNEPALMNMYQIYEQVYHTKFNFYLDKEDYDKLLNKVDYSHFADKALYINSVQF